MKVNKKLGSLRNEENEISSNEINEVLEEEYEGQHDKSPKSKREKLKETPEKPCRNAVVECKINESEIKMIMSTLPKSSG